MLSEKIELLGKGLYTNGIPDILTLKSVPTGTELDYVGAEDFDRTMVDKILPQSIEEQIPFGELLAIDYYWVCRGLRMLSYGPYYTTNQILCPDCRQSTFGDNRVDLRSVGCNVIPVGFVNDVILTADDFLEFKKDIHISLLTINEQLTKENDTMFLDNEGKMNRPLATVCYAVKQIGDKKCTPLDVKAILQKEMISADYEILKDETHSRLNFGLQAGGRTKCPKCGSDNAAFMALMDDKFFRPTVGDLRAWKTDRNNRRKDKDISGSETKSV